MSAKPTLDLHLTQSKHTIEPDYSPNDTYHNALKSYCCSAGNQAPLYLTRLGISAGDDHIMRQCSEGQVHIHSIYRQAKVPPLDFGYVRCSGGGTPVELWHHVVGADTRLHTYQSTESALPILSGSTCTQNGQRS